MDNLLKIKNLSVSFNLENKVSQAIKNISLNVERKKTLELYKVGEEYALDKLHKFIDQKILVYKEKRDFGEKDELG